MSTTPRPPELPSHLSPEADSERTSRHLRMLQAIAEMGMEFATHIHAQARLQTPAPSATQPAPATSQDPSGEPPLEAARMVAYITRGVRQSIALEATLAERHRQRIAARAIEAAQGAAAHKTLQRRRLRILMEAAIEDAPEPANGSGKTIYRRPDHCMANLDLHEDFPYRPLAETTARICHELHIPYSVRAPASHHPPA